MASSEGPVRRRRLSREEVFDALTQKKLTLDNEVEEFKRLKEDEFRRFEKELKKQSDQDEGGMNKRSTQAENESKKHPAQVKNEPKQQSAQAGTELKMRPSGTQSDDAAIGAPGVQTEGASHENENKSNLAAEFAAGKAEESKESKVDTNELGDGGSEEATTLTELSTITNLRDDKAQPAQAKVQKHKKDRGKKKYQDALMKVNGGSHANDKEDRELELRAIFTPPFLPLLDNSSHRQYLYDREVAAEEARQQRGQSDSAKLSSSLTTLPSLSDKRSEAGSVSTSQPRLGLAERRSSSSPTGTGRTLRSSLRSPDHVAKERKHVLFSIDNKVISPSTSPAASRSVGKKEERGRRTPPIPFSGLKDFPFPDINASVTLFRPGKPSGISIPEASKTAPASTGSPNPFARSYKDLVEPTIITPPDEVDRRDLSLEESNPMFDLDDPDSGANDVGDYDEEEWGVEGRTSRRPAEDDEEEDKSADIAASPHRGSVPIEIRWPGRRTS